MSDRISKDVVYGAWGDGLIFVSRTRAEELKRIWTALGQATTWGEFMAAVPAQDLGHLNYAMDDDIPSADDSFTADDVPGVADGDWPDFIAQDMLEWMPKAIQQQYGTNAHTTLNGPYLHLPIQNKADIVAAMEADGYHCAEDQSLVDAAGGIG